MNGSDSPSLRAQHAPANAEACDAPRDPNHLIALLRQIGLGAAADGQPWPERHQLPGRCLALADADGALAGCALCRRSCWRPNAPARTAARSSTWAIA